MNELNDAEEKAVGQHDEAATDYSSLRDATYVDRLKASIRQQLKYQGARPQSGLPISSTSAMEGGDVMPPIDWYTIVACLHQAEQCANIGRKRPSLPAGFSWPIRLVARCLAPMVMYFSRFMLSEQREFNNATLGCLRSLQIGLYQMEQTARRHQIELDRLRSAASTSSAQLRSASAQPTAEPAIGNGLHYPMAS